MSESKLIAAPSTTPEKGLRLERYVLFVEIPFEGYDLVGSADTLESVISVGEARDFDERWYVIDQEARMVCASGSGCARKGD